MYLWLYSAFLVLRPQSYTDDRVDHARCRLPIRIHLSIHTPMAQPSGAIWSELSFPRTHWHKLDRSAVLLIERRPALPPEPHSGRGWGTPNSLGYILWEPWPGLSGPNVMANRLYDISVWIKAVDQTNGQEQHRHTEICSAGMDGRKSVTLMTFLIYLTIKDCKALWRRPN